MKKKLDFNKNGVILRSNVRIKNTHGKREMVFC